MHNVWEHAIAIPAVRYALAKLLCKLCAGQFQGQEVAVKVSQPYYEVREQRNREDKFLHEVWMYQ